MQCEALVYIPFVLTKFIIEIVNIFTFYKFNKKNFIKTKLLIEAGKGGWEILEYKELLHSANEFLGKEELKKVKSEGIKKKLMGVKIDAKEIAVTGSMNMYDNSNNLIGELRSGSFNPMFKQVIGIAMINKPFFNDSQEIKVSINGKNCTGRLCDLPFIQ